MLAWQFSFRTFEWATAVGDLDTTMKEIRYLITLA